MKSTFLYLSLFCLILFSCQKSQPIVGCMDSAADDYNPAATSPAPNCAYTNTIVFWFDEENSTQLMGYGVTTLTLYAQGVVQGTLDVDQYLTSAPNCATTANVIRYTEHDVNPSFIGYDVFDQDGNEIYVGGVYLDPGECIIQKMDE